MLEIDFSEEEIQQLNYERYHYPHPRIQRKMEVLYLKSRGLPHREICRLCQISKTTLVSYLRQYQQGGIEQLKQWNYRRGPWGVSTDFSRLLLKTPSNRGFSHRRFSQ